MKDQLKRTTPCTKRCQLPVNHPSTKHEHWASRRHGVLDYCKDLWRLMKCSGRISSSGSNWYLWFAMICTSSLTSCNAQTCGNQHKHKLACPAINRHGCRNACTRGLYQQKKCNANPQPLNHLTLYCHPATAPQRKISCFGHAPNRFSATRLYSCWVGAHRLMGGVARQITKIQVVRSAQKGTKHHQSETSETNQFQSSISINFSTSKR